MTSRNNRATSGTPPKDSPQVAPEPAPGIAPGAGVVSDPAKDTLRPSDGQALQANQIPLTDAGAPFPPAPGPIFPPPIPEPQAGPFIDLQAPHGYKKDGTPAARRGPKGGRRPRQGSGFKYNPDGPDIQPDMRALTAGPDRDARYREQARMTVATVTGAAEMIPGWRPKTPEEQRMLEDATFTYIKAKGFPDLPPGWILLSVVAIYSFPRIMEIPFFADKIKGFLPK